MRISHRYRFIFFANPKTGSSSARRFLDPYSDVIPVKNYCHRTVENPFYPHITPAETERIFRDLDWDFYGYSRFTFVRNPWARLVSLYDHIRSAGGMDRSFDQWLLSVEPCGIGGGGEDWQRWRKYGAYSIKHYISDDSGRVLVDDVLRLEDVEFAFKPFLDRLGLPGVGSRKLGHYNKGKSSDRYVQYYSDETAAHVANLYRYDIEEYGYEFGAD